MNNENYVIIQGWMINELNLKGNELIVYAIIYGFSQSENNKFTGSLQYLADWCNATKYGIQKNLKSLLDKGFIEKEEMIQNNIKFCKYYATKLHTQCNKVAYPMQQSCINNKADSKTNKKSNNSKELLHEKNFEFGGVKKEKQSLYSKCVSLIYAKTDNEKIRKLLVQWLDMLLEKYKDKDKVLYQNIFKGKLNTLDDYDESEWESVIKYNLQKGYEAFYPIKNYSKQSNNQLDKPWEQGVSCKKMTKQQEREHENWLNEQRAKGIKVDF